MHYKRRITLTCSLVLFLLPVASSYAQDWRLSFAYANIDSDRSETFHGVNLGFERSFMNRLSVGVQTTILAPKNIEGYSYPVFSNTDQKVSSSVGYLTFDVIHFRGIHTYLKYGYGYYSHSFDGFKRTFIDFPTNGPNPATDLIDMNENNHGFNLGAGLEFEQIGNLFIEYSIFESSYNYFRLLTGFKISF